MLVENDSANITLTVQVLTYFGDNISFEVLPGSTYSFNINDIQLIGILSSSGTGTAAGTLALFPFFGFPYAEIETFDFTMLYPVRKKSGL